MNFLASNKKDNATGADQSIITGPQDRDKTFGATAIRKSLEVLWACVENNQDHKIAKRFVASFVGAFGTEHGKPDWLNECKLYLCDALSDLSLQKNYILSATTKEYLALDIAIGLLFSQKRTIRSGDIATILNTIDHGTRKYVGELDRTLQLRKKNPSLHASEIIQAAQQSKQTQSKEALLRILPLEQLAGRELSIYQLITETAKEDQKGLMELFFFNTSKSSISFNSLIRMACKDNGINTPKIFQFMESIYSHQELEQKALMLEEAGNGNVLFLSILRIPMGEKRLQYLIDKSPINNFIPYVLFDKKYGVIPQKILTLEDAVTFLKKLDELHPNNIFIKDAMGRVEADHQITIE